MFWITKFKRISKYDSQNHYRKTEKGTVSNFYKNMFFFQKCDAKSHSSMNNIIKLWKHFNISKLQ